jgi:hypothetical protein
VDVHTHSNIRLHSGVLSLFSTQAAAPYQLNTVNKFTQLEKIWQHEDTDIVWEIIKQ